MLTKAVAEGVLLRLSSTQTKPFVPLGVLGLLIGLSMTAEAARLHVLWNGRAWNADFAEESDFIAPGPFRVRFDNADVYKLGCHQNLKSSQVKTCAFGSKTPQKTIVVVGGSHSAQWLPALTSHAAAENWHIVSMTKSRCLFADPEDHILFEDLDPSCKKWNIAALEKIVQLKPDLVLSLATRWQGMDERRTEYVPTGYHSHFATLEAAGIKVFALRDNPWMDKDVPLCVYSPVAVDKAACGRKRSHVLDDVSFKRGIAGMPANVHVGDMSDHFCDKQHCWAVRHGISIYRDSNHITATYAKKISVSLREQIKAVWIRENKRNRIASGR